MSGYVAGSFELRLARGREIAEITNSVWRISKSVTCTIATLKLSFYSSLPDKQAFKINFLGRRTKANTTRAGQPRRVNLIVNQNNQNCKSEQLTTGCFFLFQRF